MLDKPVPISCIPAGFFSHVCGDCSVGDSFGNIYVAGMLDNKFLLESLILAQDERWRRA